MIHLGIEILQQRQKGIVADDADIISYCSNVINQSGTSETDEMIRQTESAEY